MTDELTAEDQLRLSVLLSEDLHAIRVDEVGMVLHALTANGEAALPLHPNCKPERYLRLVREELSSHVLGSPGGYPVFLSRWTRHGQMESANLGQLLRIGEPEAVVAVVHSPALTDELAGYAWWAMPTIEHARLMLARPDVARGRMGPVLAEFLIEHLPFLQEDHLAIMDTVAVLLDSGVLTGPQREAVWRRGRQQNSYYVAFLERGADAIPVCLRDAGRETVAAARPVETGPLSDAGLAFAGAALTILERPETQEVVSRTLRAIGHYYASTQPGGNPGDIDEACSRLAGVRAELTAPVFARSSAIGSLMRRRIAPLIAPVVADLERLRAAT